MNQQQVLAAIKQFGEVLNHRLPAGFTKRRSGEGSDTCKDQAHFIQALTELGNEVRLVFVSNTTSDFRGFLKKLNLLEEVPLWYELWRLYNGFPPSLQESPAATSSNYP